MPFEFLVTNVMEKHEKNKSSFFFFFENMMYIKIDF
jgi:hypothetical protein